MKAVPTRERLLILAPRGRDAIVAKGILRDVQLRADICLDVGELLHDLKQTAELAIVTEEAVRDADLREL